VSPSCADSTAQIAGAIRRCANPGVSGRIGYRRRAGDANLHNRLATGRERPTDMRLTALLIASSLAASPISAQQTPPPDVSPDAKTPAVAAVTSPPSPEIVGASPERIREQLAKPPPVLKPPDPTPNFTVFIEARRPLQEIFKTPPWATAGSSYSKTCPPRQASYLPQADCTSPSGGGTDILPLLRQAKRAHDAQAAHEEAQREIEAYCAAQPNGGREIAICPARSAIR
jgi:hypothetical protein